MPSDNASYEDFKAALQVVKRFYRAQIEKLADDLARDIKKLNLSGQDAWEHVYEETANYPGGSAQAATPPFDDPVCFVASDNVEDGIEDIDALLSGTPKDFKHMMFGVVRMDVCRALTKRHPELM